MLLASATAARQFFNLSINGDKVGARCSTQITSLVQTNPGCNSPGYTNICSFCLFSELTGKKAGSYKEWEDILVDF